MNNIQKQLADIREFLEIKWKQKHSSLSKNMDKEYNPPTLDHNMCRFTALFLRKVLNKITDNKWVIDGGDVWEPKYSTGGIQDKNGNWNGHYWLTSKDIIVDITANQFGHDKIIVTKKDNPTYDSNYTKKEIASHMSDAKDTVNS